MFLLQICKDGVLRYNFVMDTKNILRNSTKVIRNSFEKAYISKVSDVIVQNIKEWTCYKQARNIMLFYPFKSELSLLKLLEDTSKNFYFPVVDGNEMYPVKYDKKLGFKTGQFGISEPAGEKFESYQSFDLIFTPALSVDRAGYRIGYGKGFYDKFFTKIKTETIKIVPVFSRFFIDSIHPDKHDIPVDYIVTEKGICHAIRKSEDDLVCRHP